MFPAWFSRRRDVKAKQKQTGAGVLLVPSSSPSHQNFEDVEPRPATSFAQALSLHKAISRTRDSHLEAELAGFLARRKDPHDLSHASWNNIKYAAANEHIDAFTYRSQHECMAAHTSTGAYSHPYADDALPLLAKDTIAASNTLCFRSGSGEPALLAAGRGSSKEKPHSLVTDEHVKGSPRDIRRLVFCLQNGHYNANDNDTEDSSFLTPDSIESSFGSESSSAGSSVVRKCGFTEESRLRWSKEGLPFGSEDIEGVDVEAMSKPCYLDQTHSSAEWQAENMLECLECASCSLIMEGMPNLASNLKQAVESTKHHEMAECDVYDFQTANESLDSMCKIRFECSPSLAKSSGPTLRETEVHTEFVEHVSLITSNMQLESTECNGASGNSNSEGAKFCRVLYSKWEESSALIAAENPSLMLSSKWQEESMKPCSSQYIGSDDSDHPGSNACKDGEFTLLMSERQHHSNDLQMCELQENCNGLSVCGLHGIEGNLGCHRSKHDAYIRNGRRHRGSSFSAALPENLQGVVGDSVALVKMSHTPYEDFRQSMYEMIMEKDLEEASLDVEELLHCYLTLNSPEHHELIKEVFSDVWSSILMCAR